MNFLPKTYHKIHPDQIEEKRMLEVLDNPKTSEKYKKFAAGILKSKFGYDDDRSERDYGDPESLGSRSQPN